ncbi:MAG TPA: ABC transporter permease [Steroidobacteraceae bacterium]
MLSVAAAFVLFGLLQGMNQGVDAYVESLNTDRLLVGTQVSMVGFLPVSYAERIRRIPGVAAVADMSFFGGFFQEARNGLPVYATDVKSFFEVYPELRIPPDELRAMISTRAGAIISRPLAGQWGWKLGDTVPLGSSIWPNRNGSSSWPVTVVGIYDLKEKGNLPNMVLINYDYFDEGRTRLNGNTNYYVARIKSATTPRAIASKIDAGFANSGAQTRTIMEGDFAQAQIQQAVDIKLVADTTAGAVLFMLLFVTGNTMMQEFRERTSQLAVLRTIGFTPRRIVALVVGEAMLLCVLAAGVGLALARILFPLGRAIAFGRDSALATIDMPLATALYGIAIAAMLAVASAFPAAWRAGRLSIIDALSDR